VPWWELLLAGGTLVLALNYSFGARLSYVGACEAVTFLALTATVLFPYGLLTGTLTTRVTAQSILLGLWMLQIALFSNTQDAAGDREAGRLTLAARSAPAVNQRVIALVFAASWALTAVTLATGVLEWWTAPLLAPAWLLQGNADLAGMPTST
jgi:1,4-dihydroxy-2-naphthoate octaprenyltransferase